MSEDPPIENSPVGRMLFNAYDELSDFNQEIWDDLKSRLKFPDPPSGPFYIISTPRTHTSIFEPWSKESRDKGRDTMAEFYRRRMDYYRGEDMIDSMYYSQTPLMYTQDPIFEKEIWSLFGIAIMVNNHMPKAIEVNRVKHKRKSNRRWQKKWRKRFGTVWQHTFLIIRARHSAPVMYTTEEGKQALKEKINGRNNKDTFKAQ